MIKQRILQMFYSVLSYFLIPGRECLIWLAIKIRTLSEIYVNYESNYPT